MGWRLAELMVDPGRLGGVSAPGALAAELRGSIDAGVGPLLADADPATLPLRLPKRTVADLLACERFAIEGQQGAGSVVALLRGRALDHQVAMWVGGEQPLLHVEDLREHLHACGAFDEAAQIDGLDDDERGELAEHLMAQHDAVVGALGPIDPAWHPRAQSKAAAAFAGGALVCSAVFDLELGGPPTPLEGVILDVKSGRSGGASPEHAADALLYALLALLRDGRAPRWVGTWYSGDGALDPRPVTADALWSAVERLVAAAEIAVALRNGEPARARPGSRCRWCGCRDNCSVALPAERGPTRLDHDDDLDLDEGAPW